MHQQSLILLHPTVKEKMHLQENTLFDLDLWVKVTRNVAQCPLHHVSYAPTEFEVTTSKALENSISLSIHAASPPRGDYVQVRVCALLVEGML